MKAKDIKPGETFHIIKKGASYVTLNGFKLGLTSDPNEALCFQCMEAVRISMNYWMMDQENADVLGFQYSVTTLTRN